MEKYLAKNITIPMWGFDLMGVALVANSLWWIVSWLA